MVASTWNVLVEKTEDGKAIATVLELPSLQAVADTEQSALDHVQQLLKQRLTQAKVVSIEVEAPSENPILKFAGIFKDDPHFDDVQRYIQEYRDELDAIDDDEPEEASA